MITRLKRLFTKAQPTLAVPVSEPEQNDSEVVNINEPVSDLDQGNDTATNREITAVLREKKIEKWIIPRFHTGSLKHASKSKMRKDYPGAYSYTRSDKGWVHHYSSHAPTFAYAHAWLSVISKSHSPPDSWCLLHDLGQGQLYFVWVKSGIVQLARQCTENGVDAIILQRAQRVYITSNALSSLVSEGETQHIGVLSDTELKGFALKSRKYLDVRFLLFLAVVIAAGAWLLMPQKQIELAPKTNPYSAYNTQLERAYSASAAIENAVNLAAYGAFIPDGWSFNTVSLQGDFIALNLSRQGHGLHAVMSTWLNTRGLTSLSAIASNAVVVKIPLDQGINWHGKTVASIDTLVSNIKDNALLLGWSLISDSETAQGNVILHALSLSKKEATFAELRSLSRLLAPLPVAIKTLSLQSDAQVGVVNTSLSIEFIGVN